MARIIEKGKIVEDSWSVIPNDETASMAATGSDQKLLLPLARWETKDHPLVKGELSTGVWLAPNDDLAPLIPHLDAIPAIGILFPSFTDGRGYSLARLLRQRHGFRGELRAFGDILRDQVYFLHRCGFDVLCPREDQDVDDFLSAMNDYSWSPVVGH